MRYQRIVVLTGAGISAESGLGTFRDEDGLWTKYDLEDVATPQGFARDPAFVHEFYNARRVNLRDAVPNAAHLALAELERRHPGRVLVVTQNVDDLHERAGSCNILHMHGELLKLRCESCGQVADWPGDLAIATPCPTCAVPGYVRPHVVWFGEMPFHMPKIELELAVCDLFVSIGTSGNVYPAAGFVAEVRRQGRAHTVELNLEPSEGASLFAEARLGPATTVVPAFVRELIEA
ncbi:Sir2 family NAD+-dependent deacetylase [Desertibaculum subflavum]|uniref:Sir2 family NAD+-dependent deacetylase n=1 Tax=Desertibaculum subflavum TaxID=2268458 RepID=UPI000E66317C